MRVIGLVVYAFPIDISGEKWARREFFPPRILHELKSSFRYPVTNLGVSPGTGEFSKNPCFLTAVSPPRRSIRAR